MGDRHVLFAGRLELGPVARDRRVGVELAPVGQHQRAQRGHGLGGRPDVGDRVALPRRRAFGVDGAAPEVDHRLAVDVQRDARAELLLRQLLGQRVAHRRKARIARPRYLGHRSLLELAYRSLRARRILTRQARARSGSAVATIWRSAATWPSNAVRPTAVRRVRTRRRRSRTGRSIST